MSRYGMKTSRVVKDVISVVSGIVTISSAAWAGREIVIKGLFASTPAWLLVVAAVTSFIVGRLFRWRRLAKALATEKSSDLL
jgi:hypothetical protein